MKKPVSAHSEEDKSLKAKPGKRIGPLKSISDVLRELAKTYRAEVRGELKGAQSTRRVFILREIRTTIEADEIESRLREIEKRLGVAS